MSPTAPETITCAICGRVVPLEKSRLFWTGSGTLRTCKRGNTPHTSRTNGG